MPKRSPTCGSWFAAQSRDTAQQRGRSPGARARARVPRRPARRQSGDVGGELTAFDCLEFDADLRWIDTASEVAFLAMDLQARARHDLAHAFVNAYLDASGDHAALALLRRYQVYRALVRARVARLREAGSDSPARASIAGGYLALAQRLSRQWDPRLLVTHGLPGSGKSWVTHALVQATGAIRLRSDVERARLLGGDHYQAADSAAVYERLHALADVVADRGLPDDRRRRMPAARTARPVACAGGAAARAVPAAALRRTDRRAAATGARPSAARRRSVASR